MRIINNYSAENVEWIEKTIDPDDIRTYFQKNSKKFHKIKTGFRAESMSDADAITLVSKNLETSIIEEFLYNNLFTPKMNLFNEIYNKAKEDGATDTAALIIGISKAGFKDCPDLFFKLYDKETTSETQKLITQIHPYLFDDNIKQDSKTNKFDIRKDDVEKKQNEIDHLKMQISELNINAQEKNSILKETREKLELTKKQLKDEIEHNKLIKIQKEKEEISKDKYLMSFADLPPKPSVTYDYEWFSLVCRNPFDTDDKVYYLRLADLSIEENSINKFNLNEPTNGLFENRKKLISKFLPNRDNNFYYVANWRVVEHKTKPGFDWIDAVEVDIEPIEIVIIKDCFDIDRLKKWILNNLTIEDSSLKWLVTYNANDDCRFRTGVLIRRKDLDFTNGVGKLKKDIIQLPIFDVDLEYTFTVGTTVNKKIIYEKLYLGKPQRILPLLTSSDIIKNIILEHMTWKSFKERGYSKKNWQDFKSILDEVAKEDIYVDVQRFCNCSKEAAIEMIEDYINHADQYIQYKDIDSTIIIRLFRSTSELWNSILKDIRIDWENENKDILNIWKSEHKKMITEEIKGLEEKLLSQKEEFKNLQKELEKKNAQISAADLKITKIQNIEKKVQQKISNINDEASDFISDIFLNKPFWQEFTKPKNISDCKPKYNNLSKVQYQKLEKNICDNEVDILYDLLYNLEQCGISITYSGALSSILYACYERCVPVILAGPMASEIASMLGVALDGELPAIIDLPHTYEREIVDEIKEQKGSIIIVKNALTSEWVSHIDTLINMTNKYVVFALPFYDDLQIIPKGILSYCIPIITDILINDECLREFMLSVRNDKFVSTPLKNVKEYRLSSNTRFMNLSARELSRYIDIIELAHKIRFTYGDLNNSNEMNSNVCKKEDFFIMTLPYCYVKERALDLLHYELNRDSPNYSKDELLSIFGAIGINNDE